MQRRNFLKSTFAATCCYGLSTLPLSLFADDIITITILHTNDVHSRIEPFPMDGGKNQGFGGIAQRSTLINKIRSTQKNVLLLDAGDLVQGTPYFNFYGGVIEIKLMNQLGYDATTIGNHDFDGNMSGLLKMVDLAQFPFLSANYDFKTHSLAQKIKKYKIFHKQGIKIGVFGVGIELKGLVPETAYEETTYLEPIDIAQSTAHFLKNDQKCDLVICLSHLGYSYGNNKISDIVLAKKTANIDLIIGGHTHTYLSEPKMHINLEQKAVLINQVGWAGIYLGRVDFYFTKNKNKNKKTATWHTEIISK